jgi:hypothetical protein
MIAMFRRCALPALLLTVFFTHRAAAQGPGPSTPAPKAPASGAPSAEPPASNAPPHEPTEAELEKARTLFEEARRDEAGRRWGDALLKFRRILDTRDTASLRFHMAYCQENMGLVASASRDYERAAELAQATKGPDRKLILEDGAKSLAELAPRIPTLTLELPAGVEGVRVAVDGEAVPAERLGAALQLDPGHHAIEVTAPGKQPFRREVRLGEREKYTLSVLFEGPRDVAPPPAPKPRPEPVAPKEAEGRGLPLGAWLAGGAGVAFAGAGAGLLVTSLSQRSKLERCEAQGDRCDGDEVATAANRNLMLAGVAGGLALAGAGAAVWIALSASPKAPEKTPTTGLLIGPTGVSLRGSF